jgi:hypothetical protein
VTKLLGYRSFLLSFFSSFFFLLLLAGINLEWQSTFAWRTMEDHHHTTATAAVTEITDPKEISPHTPAGTQRKRAASSSESSDGVAATANQLISHPEERKGLPTSSMVTATEAVAATSDGASSTIDGATSLALTTTQDTAAAKSTSAALPAVNSSPLAVESVATSTGIATAPVTADEEGSAQNQAGLDVFKGKEEEQARSSTDKDGKTTYPAAAAATAAVAAIVKSEESAANNPPQDKFNRPFRSPRMRSAPNEVSCVKICI